MKKFPKKLADMVSSCLNYSTKSRDTVLGSSKVVSDINDVSQKFLNNFFENIRGFLII